MSTSVPTPSEIIESFPEPVLKIDGQPTYETLSTLRDTLKANAASVECTIGGGAHGHLGLIVPSAVYNTIVPPTPPAINSWTDPVYPGATPTIPGNTSAANATNIRAQHAENKRTFQLAKSVNAALRKQILEAVDEIYLRSIRQQHIGYSNTPSRDMLSFLFTQYGKITPQALALNNKKFEKEWDPTSPIELLIDQIDSCQEFAIDGGQPYSNEQILNNAYTLIFKSGLFFEDCRRWNALPAANKTWNRFKLFFTEAYNTLKLQQTASQTGYHAQQFMTQQRQLDDITNTFTAALQLAKDDHTALSTLSASNEANNTTLLKLINDVKDELKLLKQDWKPKQKQKKEKRDQGSYCHTHGYLVHKNHNSMNCKYPGPNHCREATRENNRGGNQEGKPAGN